MTSGLPRLKKVVINGVDVSAYVLTYEITREYDEVIGNADIFLSKGVNSILPITPTDGVGWDVTIQRGVSVATEEYVFRGEIMDIDESNKGFSIDCSDKYFGAVRAEITESFDINNDPEAGVISDIYTAIITENTDLDADVTSVQDSGTTLVLKKFVCNHADVFERACKLANALNWQHYYEPDTDKVYLEPRGFSSGTDIFEVGVNVVEVPIWKYTKDKMINKLTLRGAEQAVQTTIYQDGDNTEAQTVSLTFQPVDVKMYVGTGVFDPTGAGTKPSDNDANLKVGGKIDSTSGTYDYTYDDDSKIKKVFFYDSTVGAQPSLTPPVGTNNIETQYSYNIPAPVLKEIPDSILKYKLHQTTHVRSDIKNVSDAERYVDTTLNYFSVPFINTVLKVVNVTDIRIGRKYRCIDSNVGETGLDTFLTVTKIKIVYPYVYDEVTVGDEALKTALWEINTMDRIKRLEEAEGESQDLLLHVIGLNRTFTSERRYAYKEAKNIAEAFILGSSAFAVLGTSLLGDIGTPWIVGSAVYSVVGTSVVGAAGTWVIAELVQGDNTLKEYFYDDTFTDTSTATINTTTNIVSFTDGQILNSAQLTKGKNIESAKITAYFTGTLLFEITANGDSGAATWDTITLVSGTELEHDFTVPGGVVKYRVTSTGVSSISSQKNSLEEFTAPGIQIENIYEV